MRKVFLLVLLAACRPAGQRSEAQAGGGGEQSSAAERVVQKQAEAYNRHDLEAFVALHAPDVRFYRYPDSLVFEGHAALRERFGRLFSTAPQVHATTDTRLVHGNFVIWKETATGLPTGVTLSGMPIANRGAFLLLGLMGAAVLLVQHAGQVHVHIRLSDAQPRTGHDFDAALRQVN